MNCNSPTFRIMRKKQSFIDGVSSVVDFFGNEKEKYYFDKTEKEADANSIYADWVAVGNDMKEAIDNYGKTITTKSN
jgi:hypothetical protein